MEVALGENLGEVELGVEVLWWHVKWKTLMKIFWLGQSLRTY